MATALAAYAPESFLNYWLRITMVSTGTLGFLLGVPVTSIGDIMTVNGFAMRIITQCTALHYIIILSTAILLYTRHSFKYRIAGLIVSILIVIAANAIRLIITGLVGSISWDAFVVVHDYLWVAAFSLLILGIWILWAERRFALSRETLRSGTVVILSCTAVYCLLYLAMPLYGRFMAKMASPVFKMFTGDRHAEVKFIGEKMLYEYAGRTFTANFATDLMVVALYIGLLLSVGDYRIRAVRRGLFGLGLILCISAAVIAGGGTLALFSGKNVAVLFLWTAHGVLLQLTLLWSIFFKPEHA